MKEVDEEEEQRLNFQQAARASKARRQVTLGESQGTTTTAGGGSTPSWFIDEDSQTIWNGIQRSASVALDAVAHVGGEDSNLGLIKVCYFVLVVDC